MTAPTPPEEKDANGQIGQRESKDPRRTRALSKGMVDLAKKLDGEADFIFDLVIVGRQHLRQHRRYIITGRARGSA